MSVAPLQVVQGMAEIPHACVFCANNPADEITGKQKPAIFAPGVDVDWGSAVYVCWDCAEIISDLCGRVTRDGFDELERKYNALDEEHSELLEAHTKARHLIARITDGRDAIREVKASAKAPKAKATTKKGAS